MTGFKKIKTAVFISGRGSNLKNLIRFSQKKKSPISIDLIISNSLTAEGLKHAKKFKIIKKIFNFKDSKTTEINLLLFLKKKRINFICLAGFMKILSINFIKKFEGKIINIHPSLLPKYKGLNTHQKALKNKDKFSGCTVHYVTAKLDSGKIIMQKKIKIKKKDNIRSLTSRILKEEHILYPKAISKVIN